MQPCWRHALFVTAHAPEASAFGLRRPAPLDYVTFIVVYKKASDKIYVLAEISHKVEDNEKTTKPMIKKIKIVIGCLVVFACVARTPFVWNYQTQ